MGGLTAACSACRIAARQHGFERAQRACIHSACGGAIDFKRDDAAIDHRGGQITAAVLTPDSENSA